MLLSQELIIKITCIIICIGVVLAIFKMHPLKIFWRKYRILKIEEDYSDLKFQKDILEIDLKSLEKRVEFLEKKLKIKNEKV